MEILSIADAVKKIRIYLNRDTLRPYFVVSDGNADFKKFLDDFERIYISDICTGDFLLDTDLLVEKLDTLTNNTIVFGLGEYIFFTAQEEILRALQDKSFNRKVIFVFRGIANLLERLADEDFKFRTNQICRIEGKVNFSVVKYNPALNFPTDAQNFSELLKLMESGKTSATVQTNLPLGNVKEINNFYDAIKNQEPHFNISSDALSDWQWQEYFSDNNCEGYPPEHWRSFAAGFKNKISNPYLRFVFTRSANFEAYCKNLFFALLDVEDERTFDEFYSLRKVAVKNISSPYLADYLRHLENLPDAVKYLTDNTSEERCAMIKAVQGKEKIPDVFKRNYPAMSDYLTDYDFDDAEITNYFRQYKKIKLCNVDDENFKKRVRELATQRPYNKFETRQKILDDATPKAKLYWLDALGVEFLSYIKARAMQLELFTTIKIARANLPTLTCQNKNFYDDWQGDKFDKNQQLDELKHTPENFDADGKCSAPTYIDDELAIIDNALGEIKNDLANHHAEKIILTSDHGASRLAVMFGRENKFKMNSNGEHSGRCCPINELDEKPTCATEENGYWVLANYDKFAGGRLSSVEVHGGATLEEILVPVIEFTLQGANVEVKISPAKKNPAPLKEINDGFEFFD
ncbi:MAG: BREX-4 system phosphatase PglZ [Selenomonadaceae bacterium]|nr:BREX-4 system phosphatase PglZ [Selenomonadaceae bacterium]MBR0062287.1 BREX-4 system phosphatase PglZ [Selenomonadaceae bacterium]